MSLNKVIEIARGELGVKENPPGSNRVKYWEDYDKSFQGQPWCCSFLWWVFQKAGERMAFFGGGKTASCSMLLRWYKEQGLTVPVEQVQMGDIVILNFHGTQDTEHCGLVQDVDYDRNGKPTYVTTVEGNTTGTNGDQSNGGMVCGKYRSVRNIIAVCRPQYKPDDPQPVDDITGHWAETQIRRCMERGLMQGYPDGSFGPDKPVTRAELAVILDRLDKEDDLR